MSVTIEGITFNGGDAYTRVTYRGVTLNKRTAAMLIRAQRIFGRPFNAIPQGSYHGSTPQSGGTHDGGGAVDIFDSRLDDVQRTMRTVGFADWHRTEIPGLWGAHCHGIALGDKEMSSAAAAQIPDYRQYLNGLADHGPDNTWHPFPKGSNPVPVFDYEQWLKEQDMQASDDAYPADPANNTTWADLWHRLDNLDEFRTSVKNQFDFVQANEKAQTDAIKTVGVDVDKLQADVDLLQVDVKAVLAILKAP